MFCVKYCLFFVLCLKFSSGKFAFFPGQQLRVANSTRSYIITDTFEIVLFHCPQQENPDCFRVFTPKFYALTVYFTEEDEKICIHKIDIRCLGITTKGNTTIVLSCDLIGNIPKVPSNAPPPVR